MRRIFAIALALGLLTATVGCDELLKTDKNKAEEKAATDKAAASKSTSDTPSTAEKPQQKKPLDFVDVPTTDPVMANAIDSRNLLVAQEEELLQRLDDLRELFASAKADPDKMRQSIEEFIALAKEIRGVVVQAGESLSKLEESSNDLARSMKHLGSSYRATAALFRLKARDYTQKKLRDQLLGFADDYEAIAKSIPERMKSLQAFQKSLPKLKLKIREASAFLDDVASFLSSHPGLGSDGRERYGSQFETFMTTFSELVRTLEDFRSTFRDMAFSKVIRDAARKDALAREKVEAARREDVARLEADRVRDAAIASNAASYAATSATKDVPPEPTQPANPVIQQSSANYSSMTWTCNLPPQPTIHVPQAYVVYCQPTCYRTISTVYYCR